MTGRPRKVTAEQVWQAYEKEGTYKKTAQALNVHESTVRTNLRKYREIHGQHEQTSEVSSRIEPTVNIASTPETTAQTEPKAISEILAVETAPEKAEAVKMQKGYSSVLPIVSAGEITEEALDRPNSTPVNLSSVSLLLAGGYKAYFKKRGYSDLTDEERTAIEQSINGIGQQYLPEEMKKHAPLINGVTAVFAPIARREIFEGNFLDKVSRKKSKVIETEPPKQEVEKTEFEKQLEAAQKRQQESMTKGEI